MNYLINRVLVRASVFVVLSAVVLSLISAMGVANAATTQGQKNKVLMVVSGFGQADGSAPGYEFDEFAKAYLVFTQHGIDVDVASPNGGRVEADKYNSDKPYNASVLADPIAMDKLNNTLALSTLVDQKYDALFIVGGKGAMFDLPNNAPLQSIIARHYENNKAVAAVCHGPAALVNVQLSDGNYLVAGKAVNGFTNQEESLFGKKWAAEFDFLLEDKLIKRGGKFQSSEMMLSHVAVDERLITGQNPASTVPTALALVKQLGIESKPINHYRDDVTLALVADVLAGDTEVLTGLNAEQHHIELIGMYGYYYAQAAKTDKESFDALTLMQAAQPVINNPMLDLAIAKTQQALGQIEQANDTLQAILSKHPEHQPALDMMANLPTRLSK